MSDSIDPDALYRAPRLYDLLCPRLVDGDPELAFWRRICADAQDVLELGCGTGRVAIPLARGGLRVTGLDRAPAMLERARAASAEAGVDVRWLEGDMTALALDGRFDVALVALNALLHLHTRAEYEALLAGVRAHLRPGGALALSILNPDPRTLGRAPHHRLGLLDAPVNDPVADRPLMVEETVHYDHVTQTTRGRLHFSYPDARDFLVTPADLRVIYPRELEDLLHYNGWELVARWGDFDFGPFTGASLVQNALCRPR